MLNVDNVFGADNAQVNGDILEYVAGHVHYTNAAAEMVMLPVALTGAAEVGTFEPLNFTKRETGAILILNAYTIHVADPAITHDQAVALAYYRYLAIKYRLVSNNYSIADYHVEYNQCMVSNVVAETVDNMYADNNVAIPQAEKIAISLSITNVLTAVNRKAINRMFVNMVCLLAYIFRIRGHHYKADFAPKIEKMWDKTPHAGKEKFASFQHIFTYGLHAIFPSILDQFWLSACDGGWCDDIFIIRRSVYAAGTSVFAIVRQGITDLKLVLPKLNKLLADNIHYIDETCNRLDQNRWDHSINARYYGANTDRLNETPIGIVASLIKSCVEALVSDNPLLSSKALTRAANLAPLSGAAYGNAVKLFIKTERFLDLKEG